MAKRSPGTGASYLTRMEFYILLGFLGFFLMFLYPKAPKRAPSTLGVFLLQFSAFSALTWSVLTGIGLLYPAVSSPPLMGSDRIAAIVFLGLFVGATEELFFRVVLPLYTKYWWIGSCVIFAFFHVIVYSTQATSLSNLGSSFDPRRSLRRAVLLHLRQGRVRRGGRDPCDVRHGGAAVRRRSQRDRYASGYRSPTWD